MIRLDRRIQIRRAELVDDGMSQVPEWSNHGQPIWAQKHDLSDGEKWRSGEIAASVTTRFTVRWSPFTADLRPQDRLICEGLDYEIVGMKEGKGRRQWLELTCAARTDTVTT